MLGWFPASLVENMEALPPSSALWEGLERDLFGDFTLPELGRNTWDRKFWRMKEELWSLVKERWTFANLGFFVLFCFCKNFEGKECMSASHMPAVETVLRKQDGKGIFLRLQFWFCHGSGCSHGRLGLAGAGCGGPYLSPQHLGLKAGDQEPLLCELAESLSTACVLWGELQSHWCKQYKTGQAWRGRAQLTFLRVLSRSKTKSREQI